VTNGGFQNYQHLVYGLPNGFFTGGVLVKDTSDILDRYRKYTKQERNAEEAIAAQILRKRLDKQRKKLEKQKLKKQIEEQLEAGATAQQIANQVVQEIEYEFTEETKRKVDEDISAFVAKQLDEQIAKLRANLEQIVEKYYNQIKIEKHRAKIKRRKRNVKKAKILFMLLQAEDEI
jgi:hypothetical protein